MIVKTPGGTDDAPAACLQELGLYLERASDIGTLWNWPRCGLPSAVHAREDTEDLLEDFSSWWGCSDLFVSEVSGEAQTLENGLVHLLQIGLLCRDVQLASEADASHTLWPSTTILANPDLRDALHDIIVTEATNHIALLHQFLVVAPEADNTEAFPGDEGDDYDLEDLELAKTVEEHAAELLVESEPQDVYMRTVYKSLDLDAVDSQRIASNAAVRAQQNKDNRQRTGFIHPPKPPAAPKPVPNLAFVNDVELPDVTALVANKQSRKKGKQKASVRVRRAPVTKRAVPSSSDETRQQPVEKQRSKRNMSRGGKVLASRTSSPERTGPPRKRRRLVKARSPVSAEDSDDAAESFNLDGFTDSDNDEGNLPDDTSQSHQGHPEVPGASSLRRRSRSLLDETRPFLVGTLRPVAFDAVDNPVKQKPRPRPVRPGRPRKEAGVSTSFGDEPDAQSHVNHNDLPPANTRGRRSSLRRSGTHDGLDSPSSRTRSHSHSVRFADQPPASSTRSKSRDAVTVDA